MEKITAPIERGQLRKLKAGQRILLDGVIYTARDQAHKRLFDALKQKNKLPINLNGQIIYYCGPAKTPKGKAIGSCGPTTSSRMDKFSPALLKVGLAAMIGKGRRSSEVVKAIKKHKGVYFLTYAGCGALLSTRVKEAKLVAYPELGPEAIYRLKVKAFPMIVGVDSKGKEI